ncbi:MFS transporter [Luteolibacter flavescens]|uniref:MFS transporter n=1 Tax=Luteolibacter flavescens TaxID=1859460 RepID=A0ABT3FQ75_9BACT|nr:MFS transporter [Luteolibacter flavescens]MCW1885729.1 MFS transporter [Luteolibacter flavescens]
MIARFSLYGFLKNLRFFEAFLILALRERGMDFLGIGGLIAVREIAGNLSQIPSGALADAIGRRRCMIASMACYVVSYLVLGFASDTWMLVGAMVFYGTADAFRDGTHKALIYSWLREQGREGERTKVYGYTRSWSKMGSALSSLIAAALVFFTGNFSTVFLLSAIPAALNLVNLATYPAALDEGIPRGGGLRQAWRHLRDGFQEVVAKSSIRRLIADSVSVEGSYSVVKDYLQVVVQAFAVALPVHLAMTGEQRTAVLGGIAYAALHILSSRASRSAHRFEERRGGTEPAISRLMWMCAISMMALGLSLFLGIGWLAVLVFIALGILQNLWRPIHIGRFDRDGEEKRAATVLSIESQASSLAAAIWAPLIGLAIDRLSAGADPAPLHTLWPVALVCLPLLVTSVRRLRA